MPLSYSLIPLDEDDDEDDNVYVPDRLFYMNWLREYRNGVYNQPPYHDELIFDADGDPVNLVEAPYAEPLGLPELIPPPRETRRRREVTFQVDDVQHLPLDVGGVPSSIFESHWISSSNTVIARATRVNPNRTYDEVNRYEIPYGRIGGPIRLHTPYRKPKPIVYTRDNVLCQLEPYVKVELRINPYPMLSPVGVEEVRNFLSRYYDINWTYTNVADMLGLEENIQNHIFEMDGEDHKCGGKFGSRLSKVLHIRHGIRMSEEDKNVLNQVLESHWVGGESYWIDRATNIDWEAGEFGEKKSQEGSCWWYEGGLSNPRSRVRRFSARMEDGMTGALRLWMKQGDDFKGVGRVWFIRTPIGNPILFNGYGLTTMQWAAKLSKLFNVDDYTQVSLHIDPNMIINNNSGVIFDFEMQELLPIYNFHLGR